MPKICQYSSGPWQGSLAHDGPQAVRAFQRPAAPGIGLRPIIGGTPMPRTMMPRTPRAFTLMEMTVSIVIMVVVMLSVGVIFQSAGRTVGVSQASMEMLSNVRAIQQQIANDVGGIDKDCFLVIRSATFTDPADADSANPNGKPHRCDLISFISYGSFPHRTGTTGGQPFTDNNTIAPAAFITWGQLALEKLGAVSNDPTDATLYLSSANQSAKVALNQVPTGIETVPAGLTDGALTLGRTAMLLAPRGAGTTTMTPGGTSVAAYQNATSPLLCAIDYDYRFNGPPVVANSTYDPGSADITQSRIDLAATTPSQIMSYLMQSFGGSRSAGTLRYEADHFCYRHASLRSPYDGANLINGYFRMYPIALQGVTSLAVDWTDGAVYTGSEVDVTTGTKVTQALVNTTRWYGFYGFYGGAPTGQPRGNSGNFADHMVDPAGSTATNDSYGNQTADHYTAIFSYDNRAQWPVALRFRYHISDPTNRLQNGRDFVQVVRLPN